MDSSETASGEALVAAARAARQSAYAPYSQYLVGAAVRTADGRVFAGCNVENTSYGLSVCAERIAVFGAVAAGAREIVAVAVVTQDGGTPCGACLQVLAEFAPDAGPLPVYLAAAEETGGVRETTLDALLPDAFRLRTVSLPTVRS